jgi:hypothetical protein
VEFSACDKNLVHSARNFEAAFQKAGIVDSGLLFHEMVAGVRFELTTFGL